MERLQNDKSDLKFIYWFAHYNLSSPSVRYRGKYALDFLKDNFSVNSYFVYPSYKPVRMLLFVRAYFSALFFRKKGSIIVIQRINSKFIYANLLKLLVKVQKFNSIYDIDDADYLEYPPETIYFFAKNCTKISVGSNELVKNLSKFNTHIVLNTSSTPDFNIFKKGRNSLFTIGWIGGFGGDHKLSLTTIFFPSLKTLHFKVKLVLLGVDKKSECDFLLNYFKDFENVILEMPQDIDWNNEVDIQNRISQFDIGIATLMDNEMQRSKSAFKAKQYMNNGVPVLSVDISENNLFVTHSVNGFLCSSPEEFKQRITEVHDMNSEQYQYLSQNARVSIPKFSLETYCTLIKSSYLG